MEYSSTSGPRAATVPIYSWPGVKFLLKGRPPKMLAGEPEWMISRSVAQIATASMRTRTSARTGTGTGFSLRNSWSGSPSTQALIRSGIGRSGEVLTPGGRYIGEILFGRERIANAALSRARGLHYVGIPVLLHSNAARRKTFIRDL